MDWPRAKTILILAFLLLDGILGYQLWREETGAAFARWASASPLAREDLLREGIVLLAPLPDGAPARMRRLRVRARPVEAERLAAAFFPQGRGDAADPGDGRTGALVYRQGGEQLTILPQGVILYERRDLAAGEPPAGFDAAAARRVTDAFVGSRGLLPADVGAAFDYAVPAPRGRPGAYQVFYVQRYRGWPLFGGYLGIEVAGGSVRALEALWLEVGGFVGPRSRVIPAEQALRLLARELAAGGDEGPAPGANGGAGPETGLRLLVERVELGYAGRLQPGVLEWEVVPAWRVLTRDGRAFYVNAYTGTVEESP